MKVSLCKHQYGIDDIQSVEHCHSLAEHKVAHKSNGRYTHHSYECTVSVAQEIEYGYREKEKE